MKIYIVTISNNYEIIRSLVGAFSTEELAREYGRGEIEAREDGGNYSTWSYEIQETELISQQYSDQGLKNYKRHHLWCSNSLQNGPCSNCDRLYREHPTENEDGKQLIHD